MSEEAEEIKRLVGFKKKLEEKVEKLESEVKELQTMLEAVNSVLLAKGFRRAEIATPRLTAEFPPSKGEEVIQPPSVEAKEIIPLNAVAGELLAELYVGEDSLRVVLAEDKDFNINASPFTQFLVERVFTKMQEKDSELVRAGQLSSDKIFSYNIVRDGDIIREITIKYFDQERLRELKSSIRWTLEKMFEKMKN